MADAPKLKDYFTPDVVARIATRIGPYVKSFDVDRFSNSVLRPHGQPAFHDLGFTERTRRIADAIEAEAQMEPVALLDALVQSLPEELDGTEGVLSERFDLWPYSDVIARHGEAHPTEALSACYELTKRFTSEFAIRPILATHPERLSELAEWAHDPNEHVRRLVSEGTRPRLPWAQRLSLPLAQVLDMLSVLRTDTSKYVRNSVANHLNDLAKDEPERIIDLLASWHQEGAEETQWIVRHALRNHLKDGTPAALKIFGYKPPRVTIDGLVVQSKRVRIGDSVEVKFSIASTSESDQLLMVDLVMGYVKANGSLAPKVFKYREFTLSGSDSKACSKRFDMVVRSTRKLYPGEHTVTVRVNGEDAATSTFTLTE